ncbi:MAG: squalene synthase HpnC [Pseudomonadota bacterium]|uniref:squalene synthase HpnC n=1 Tax=Polaromonas sp. TaxID=1869339 RepID=UPI001841F91A|nr:squalene synthase HpnC [Polaromonas sp.]MBA3594539.1 squalene synthase HpnC [Polaromonas sp.]MDQ3272247.1 squalene synthase HpnC [Pseudomonadota bacterium]
MSPAPHTGTPQALKPASQHYENFPVASLLCPPRLRPAITAIYWFARTADDIADEGDARPAQRLQDLAVIREDLFAAAEGQPGSGRWPEVFGALQPVIAQFDLPVALLADLLSAFEQDVVKQRYATEAELLGYCRRSANPVGRLLLHLYGVHDADSLAQSDHICSALQLINFWQDLSVDIPRGRIYIPRELWSAYGVDEVQLMARDVNPATTKLIAACARTARASMLKGAELPAAVAHRLGGFDGWRAGLELRCVIQGGLRILDKIEAMDHRTLAQRPKLGVWDAVVIFSKALWR